MATTWSPTCMASEDPRSPAPAWWCRASGRGRRRGSARCRRGQQDRPLVAQLDLDDVGAVDDVRVGRAAVSGDDHARAEAANRTTWSPLACPSWIDTTDGVTFSRRSAGRGPARSTPPGPPGPCGSGPGVALSSRLGPPRSRRHRPRPRATRPPARRRKAGWDRLRAVSTAAEPSAVEAGSFPRRGLTPRRSWPSCALRGCIGHPSGN
jgi:hypothetical protein